MGLDDVMVMSSELAEATEEGRIKVGVCVFLERTRNYKVGSL